MTRRPAGYKLDSLFAYIASGLMPAVFPSCAARILRHLSTCSLTAAEIDRERGRERDKVFPVSGVEAGEKIESGRRSREV